MLYQGMCRMTEPQAVDAVVLLTHRVIHAVPTGVGVSGDLAGPLVRTA